jgi:hypothetical protein
MPVENVENAMEAAYLLTFARGKRRVCFALLFSPPSNFPPKLDCFRRGTSVCCIHGATGGVAA